MFFKGLSLLFLGFGVFTLMQVMMPYLSYQIWELTEYKQNIVLFDPSPKREAILGVSIENVGNFPAIYSDSKRENKPYEKFHIYIPSIKLEKTEVIVDTNDFEQNLAHLPGTALPGEKGNVFVTGHSSLTQFYRPDNFKAILANLPKVKKGDEILIDAAGQRYRYVVEGLRVVDPTEVSVVNAPDGVGRYLTLMTCVPPGFNTKRLIVLARLK